jgi:hypothetical protein
VKGYLIRFQEKPYVRHDQNILCCRTKENLCDDTNGGGSSRGRTGKSRKHEATLLDDN